MKRLPQALLFLGLVLTVILTGVAPTAAQTVTTGNIGGVVVDQQGASLPGVTVTATHAATGTVYTAVTRTNGSFSILNVRVGTYVVKATMQAFKDEEVKDVDVKLGEDRSVEFKMKLASFTEQVTVTAESPLIDTSNAGAAGSITNQMKENLPTINRSIADIVRSNPFFNATGGGSGADNAAVVSVAGTTFRYNGLQIDGAANNDLFGLSGSAGSPGGATNTQPISLDAIQEIQLVVSPYDVRQGGFTGGGINVVTKTGTNNLHGTGFFYGRNQAWVGDGITGVPVADFKDKQGGFSVGGPIRENKSFFFATLDDQRRLNPTGVSVGSNPGQAGNEALIDQYLSILKNTYNYDPGPDPKGVFSRAQNSNKFFARADFNVAKGHQLTVRQNYVGSLIDIGTPTPTSFLTPDRYYRMKDYTNSTVGQLNSAFGNNVNELRLAYTSVSDRRGAQPFEQTPFPQITVVLAGSQTISSGREQFSMANRLDQHIFELTDSYTMVRGAHTITVGTHDEFFHFYNLFIRDNFGTYRFSSLANFQAGLAQQYDYSFSATSDPKQAAQFNVNQMSGYIGDTWRAAGNLTVTLGARVDVARFPDVPNANPLAVTNFGKSTNVVPNNAAFSPRVGFNWSPFKDRKSQIRGGVGGFTGRPPYVWISNQYGNTGVDFTRVGASNNTLNTIPFTPGNPSPVVTGATAGVFTNEIDLMDPNFKYPRVLRGNVGYDRQLGRGLTATADLVWSKTLEDISYQNLNYAPSPTATGIGGRPFMVKQVASLSDVIYAQNTTAGHSWNMAYDVKKTMARGFLDAAYSYGHAYSVYDTTSDQAASVWGNAYIGGDPNSPAVSRSTYDPGHRINLSGSYDFTLPGRYVTTVSMTYVGQSGRPYSLVFFPDVNGDTKFNDLFYIPSSATDQNLTYTGGTYQDLANFIQADSCLSQYVGQIMPRNACRSPWKNTLDARVAVRLPVRKVRADVSLDMLNLLNLLDKNKGIIQYSSFAEINAFSTTPGTPSIASPITGYNITTLTSPTFTKFLRDDLRSRWQLQLGVRVVF